MPATAALVAKTIGKNAVMKIRKIDGTSPIPNHRIANGIQASGERLRKKLTAGRNARRTRTRSPSQSPTGMPSPTARPKPIVTRNSEATTSSKSDPRVAFSTNPRTTSSGDGKAVDGNTSNRDRAAQIASATSAIPAGRTTPRDALPREACEPESATGLLRSCRWMKPFILPGATPGSSDRIKAAMDALTRRRFLGLAGIAGLGTIAVPSKPSDPPAATAVPEEFPTQSPALAREMVGVSHGNIARVKELLALHPTLANAAWDWGFGDWETALGAASHVGNPEIATALLAQGARPTIFSAAMLGQLAVVRAFIDASLGIQATPGPHGITLLAHAKAGGDVAKAVVSYLFEKGGADPAHELVELAAELAARYAGVYAFGSR